MLNKYGLLFHLDVSGFAAHYLGIHLDPWQRQAVSALHPRGHLLTARQVGKTTVLAIRIVHHLVFHPGAKVLVVSATEIQAGQVISKVREFLLRLGEDVAKLQGRAWDLLVRSTKAELRALPCREAAMRGYTATLVVLDEAALIADKVFHAVMGTLASTWHSSSVWLASTPRQPAGFFYDFILHPRPDFLYLCVTAEDSGRLSPEFLALEREILPEDVFNQEYNCGFGQSQDAAFREADLSAALADRKVTILSAHTIPPLHIAKASTFYLTNDLAQARDFSTLCILEHRPRYLGQDPVSLQHLFHGELFVRWIQRFPLGLDYQELLRLMREAVLFPELQAASGLELVFDKSGGGAVFHDFLKAANLGPRLTPIVITSGNDSHEEKGTFYVPKHELIKTTQFAFRNRVIKIAPDCRDVRLLLDEMKNFRKIVSLNGHESYHGRAGFPDDLLMGLSLGVWRAFQRHRGSIFQDPKGESRR